jgi:hypothetical protein
MRKTFLGRVIQAVFIVACTLSARPESAQISELSLSPDSDYLHVEWKVNPADLAIFPEMDVNRDGKLSSAELRSAQPALRMAVEGSIKVRVNQTGLTPDITALTAEENGGRLVWRAHYAVDGRRANIQIDSNLAALTRPSHITRVNLHRSGRDEFAQLDARSRVAQFEALTPIPGFEPARNYNASQARGILVLMAAPCLLIVLGGLGFLQFRLHHPRFRNLH